MSLRKHNELNNFSAHINIVLVCLRDWRKRLAIVSYCDSC